ncbi:MAG: glycosyltransferase family 1 protein [Dehalococcoidia bacterium]|nr:glycosyltransferase family 1 protein [Dehalococcoidia bacterium]
MARSLRPPLTGIGRYTLNLARAVGSALPKGSLSLFLTRDSISLNGTPGDRATAPLPTPHELLRVAWEQTVVPLQARGKRLDVYHSPNYTLPLALPCPGVLTVHDLAFLRGRLHNQRLQIYLRLFTNIGVRRASQIICVSEATRADVELKYPAARGRTSVVYSGLDPRFEKRPAESEVAVFRREHGLERPYVLFVGSIEPRKNLPRLVQAFERAVAEAGIAHDLVICGPWGWRYGRSAEAMEGSPLAGRIRRMGYVPDANLPLLYAGADTMAYVSLFEGFGFPLLEAMAMGTPVVTSNVSSMPEVVGGAALTVSPKDVGSIAAGLISALTDSGLAARLREAGPERAREFTWERCGRETIEVYRRAMSGA